MDLCWVVPRLGNDFVVRQAGWSSLSSVLDPTDEETKNVGSGGRWILRRRKSWRKLLCSALGMGFRPELPCKTVKHLASTSLICVWEDVSMFLGVWLGSHAFSTLSWEVGKLFYLLNPVVEA